VSLSHCGCSHFYAIFFRVAVLSHWRSLGLSTQGRVASGTTNVTHSVSDTIDCPIIAAMELDPQSSLQIGRAVLLNNINDIAIPLPLITHL
jgi:hypothetical protein